MINCQNHPGRDVGRNGHRRQATSTGIAHELDAHRGDESSRSENATDSPSRIYSSRTDPAARRTPEKNRRSERREKWRQMTPQQHEMITGAAATASWAAIGC